MASREPPGDPRAVPLGPGEADIRPVVALPRSGLPPWAIGALAVLAAVILFVILDARRRAPTSPDVRVQASEAMAGRAPPPPLYLPQAPPPQVIPGQAPTQAPASRQPARAAPPAPPQIIYVPQPMPVPAPEAPQAPPPPARSSTEPALVVDVGTAGPAPAAEGEPAQSAAAGAPISGSRRSGVAKVRPRSGCATFSMMAS